MQEVITIRASSLGELFDCAMRWEAKHLLGMRMKSSSAAHLGTSIHAGTAIFDSQRVLGSAASVEQATTEFMEVLRDDSDVDWRGGDLSKRDAEHIGILLTHRYCNEVSPQFDYVAVEFATRPYDIEVDGVIIQLTGTLDRARAKIGANGVGISDVKTGKRAVDADTGFATTRGHAPQLGVYELLYEHTTGVPITEPASIIGLQTTKSATVGIGEIKNAREQLIGDQDSKGLLEYAAMYLKQGMFPPNPKSQLCSDKFCPKHKTCKFKE